MRLFVHQSLDTLNGLVIYSHIPSIAHPYVIVLDLLLAAREMFVAV
jgi:hypothetical protein